MLAPRRWLHVILRALRSGIQWADQSSARTAWNVLLVRGSLWTVEMKYLQAPPSPVNPACLVKHTPQHTKLEPAKIARTADRIARRSKPAHWRPRPSAENVKLALTSSSCWACANRVLSAVMTARTLSSLSAKYPVYPQISSAVLHDQASVAKCWLLRVSGKCP